MSDLYAALYHGVSATPIATHRRIALQTARDTASLTFNASTAIPTNGRRLPQVKIKVKISAQHRRVGAYSLWKFHAHGANSLLWRKRDIHEASYPALFLSSFLLALMCGTGEGKENICLKDG